MTFARRARFGLRASFSLLFVNYAEKPVSIIVRAGSEEELVGGPIRGGSATELNSPKLVDADIFAIHIRQCPDKLAGYSVEGVNDAGGDVVAYEQRIAERSEIAWRNSQAPRLIQFFGGGELLQKSSVFAKDIDDTTDSVTGASEGNVDQAAEVLNTVRSKASGYGGVGERFYELKILVIDVDFIVCVVRSEQEILGSQFQEPL